MGLMFSESHASGVVVIVLVGIAVPVEVGVDSGSGVVPQPERTIVKIKTGAMISRIVFFIEGFPDKRIEERLTAVPQL
jgi:hypothetical protein